ncbi:Insulin-degrading enzyme (Insulin protease) (Insulinase) (Insulysin) [Durusdinium trenchii]|uniref:Insulin-degrading enzyme (Insulin protease) (Insulinase) (Insulysin) n=1 Tax=Durusdinium trenchii TaxID=1381693 RepID=A0ABP0IY05_9DINO
MSLAWPGPCLPAALGLPRPVRAFRRSRSRAATALRAAQDDSTVLTGLGQICSVASWPVEAENLRSEVFAGEVMKSPLDSRNYRALTLQNGMKVLLASDPEAISAACALSVHLGFYSDPEDLPGLAHFCEHMLFLGTKEYPEENSFEKFLTANSGSQNVPHLQLQSQRGLRSALQESLKRFSSFFREPLFTASGIEREVSAIDSEFAKNRENDGFRLAQLLKSTAAEGHPERHFGCGNRETLLSKGKVLANSAIFNKPSKEINHGQEELRNQLLRYFQGYDPSLMALCVVGKAKDSGSRVIQFLVEMEPLNVLQSTVEQYLGAVPRRSDAPRPRWAVAPYPPENPAKILEAVPVNELRSVLLEWTFDFENFAARKEFLLAKAQDYLAQILGHEGPGSMHSILKGKGWVNRTTAGVSFDQDDFAIFRLSFDVSEEGLRQKNAIFGAVFSVLNALRQGSPLQAVPDYTIQECRSLAELRWRFAEKLNSQPLCLDAVDLMQDGLSPAFYLSNRFLLLDPPGDGPSGGSLLKAIDHILEQLTPERARYRVFAKDVAPKQSEKWYGVPYRQTEIPKSVLQGWRWSKAPILPGWHVPDPNKFIPQNFALAWPQQDRIKAAALPPELIRNDERWRVFFKADRAFGIPKATCILQCWFPDPSEVKSNTPASSISTAEGRVLARLWQASLADRLTEEYYAARLAGLAANCASTVAGISLSFSGYSDKLLLFVQEVLQKIRDFDGPTPSEFARALDALKREQASFDFQQPYAHAAYFSRLATYIPEYPVEELRAATKRVTLEQVRNFSALLRAKEQSFFGQALIIGNLSVEAAKGILETFDVLPFKGALKGGTAEGLLRSRFAKLQPGQEILQVQPEPNPEETNHALVSLFWTGDELLDGLHSNLLDRVMKAPFYDSIRTQQQLGAAFVIQEDFCKPWMNSWCHSGPRQLQPFKASLKEELLRPDQRLASETGFQYNWRRREEEAALIGQISMKDLLQFYDERIAAGGSLRRRANTAVFANSPKRAEAMRAMKEAYPDVVEDPVKFGEAAPKWPIRNLEKSSESSHGLQDNLREDR